MSDDTTTAAIRGRLEAHAAETPEQKWRRELDEAVVAETLLFRGMKAPESVIAWREDCRFLLAENGRLRSLLGRLCDCEPTWATDPPLQDEIAVALGVPRA
jgi:hypothetical protein